MNPVRAITFFFCAALFLVSVMPVYKLCNGGSPNNDARESKRVPPQLSTVLAQGFRYREYATPKYDLIRFSSCRVEKVRRGFIALGGFNHLVFDDLEVVLPDTACAANMTNGISIPELGLSEEFLKKQAHGLRFSGVKINRLMLYQKQQTMNMPVPYLKAEKATSTPAGLKLEHVLKYTLHDQSAYGVAYLVYDRTLKNFQFRSKLDEKHAH